VHKFQDVIKQNLVKFKALILRMRDVPYLDADGLRTLEDIFKECKKSNCRFYISDIHTQPLMQVINSGFLDTMGEANVFGNLDDALEKVHLDLNIPYKKNDSNFAPTVTREIKQD